MIPKTIHYCWFGGNKKGKLINKCIDSWKKHCPDYEIVEWNETNFDVNAVKFTKQAYESEKWAFVSDYVRLNALFNYGGVYLDTDVELVKPLDDLMEQSAFSGFEDNGIITTGVLASEKHHPWISKFFEYYQNKEFIDENGVMILIPNTEVVSLVSEKYFGYHRNSTSIDETHLLEHGVTLYPWFYFCPKSHYDGKIRSNKSTYAIHHFNGSWLKKSQKVKIKIVEVFTRFLGLKTYFKIKKLLKR